MGELDPTKAEAFAGRMVGVLNDGFLALMTSIGHQTGLFDAMAELPASTSEEIAKAAGLNERYVREWLGSMVTAGVVDYEPEAARYRLPPEHATAVTRAAGPNNLAALHQWVACMASVEQPILRCFREGGGLAYDQYDRFHRIMAESNGQVFEGTLVQRTLPLVPGLVPKLQAGIDVLDLGCGSGRAVNVMAEAFPKSRFVGLDFSKEGVEAGRQEARQKGLPNARFDVHDAAVPLEPASFDLITTFDVIHDQAKPAQVLRNIAGALRDDGTYLMVDIAASTPLEGNLDHPLGPFLYAISTLHCMSVSLGLDGAGLGTVWGEELAKQMLKEAGFEQVTLKRVEGDVLNNYYIARRG